MQSDGLCECGCGSVLVRTRACRKQRFVVGHNRRGKSNTWKMVSEPAARTSHGRARKLLDVVTCEMARIGGCRGRIEAHHKNKNELDNSPENLMAVCRAHHKMLDNGRLTPDSSKMPDFYVDGSGKRRYAKRSKNAVPDAAAE